MTLIDFWWILKKEKMEMFLLFTTFYQPFSDNMYLNMYLCLIRRSSKPTEKCFVRAYCPIVRRSQI